MLRTLFTCFVVLAACGALAAESRAEDEQGDKRLSGMSIVGDHETPKSLVIVPWKSSDMGKTLDVSRTLDDERRPVDREVFMRQLSYFQLRAEAQKGGGPGAP